METQTKRLIQFLILPLMTAVIIVLSLDLQHEYDYKLRVNFYDVGQGDSIFIQTYLGNQILIDGGPGSQVVQRLGEDMPAFDRTIEMIILSHPHADHVSGLIEVIKRYKVKQVLLPEVEFDSSAYKEFLSVLEEKSVQKIYAHQGMRIYLDNATVFDIYHPGNKKFLADNDAKGLTGEKVNPNDTSIVGKLSFGKNKILFMGDATEEVEELIIPVFNLDSDILKVGHHGSRYSTTEELIDDSTPEYAVIQVGKNTYGHPTEEVLEKLKQNNVKVFRNDVNGTINFELDGNSIFVK